MLSKYNLIYLDDYLLYMSQRLKRCADSQDIEFGEDRNEYASQFDTIMRNHRVRTEEGTKITELTPEEKAELQEKVEQNRALPEHQEGYVEEADGCYYEVRWCKNGDNNIYG